MKTERNSRMMSIDQVMQEAEHPTREYKQSKWRDTTLPNRARFIMKMKFFDGGAAAFYSYDFETIAGKWKENEELGLTKLCRYLNDTRGKWFTVIIYACLCDAKSTGKQRDSVRANYSLLALHFVESRREQNRKRYRNKSIDFVNGMMVR